MKARTILPLFVVLLVFILSAVACGNPKPPATSLAEPTETEAQPSLNPIDLTTGLIAYYPFDGDLNDASGNGHNGQLVDPIFTADASERPNRALSFNGQDTIVVIPDADGLDLTGDFSISMWVIGEPDPTHQWLLISKHQAGQCIPEHASWFLRYSRESGGLFISYYDSSAECGTHLGYGTDVPMDDGIWHSLAITYERSSGSLSYYFDCQLVFQESVTLNMENNSIPLTLGNQYLGPESTNFAGAMDEVRLYGQVLEEAQLQALCTLE